LRLFGKKVLTAVIDTERDIITFPSMAAEPYRRTYSTRIAEVENRDAPDGPEKPAGNDRGILWRLNSYWRLLEKDGGTYVQIEFESVRTHAEPNPQDRISQ